MKYSQITTSMAKDIAFNLGAVLNDEEAGAFADGYNVAMLKVNKDMSTALSNNASLSTNSPVIPDFSFSGLVNSARALLDVLYEFGADEVAISEYVTNLEDALRVAAAPQQEVK
ncbi:TPA: hypothetical protein ACSUND_000603 [Salmonella enterica subsp. diarizonae]